MTWILTRIDQSPLVFRGSVQVMNSLTSPAREEVRSMVMPRIIGSDSYMKTLEWVRTIDIPDRPHRLPDQNEFMRMVSERPRTGFEDFDIFGERKRGVSKEYELAYMEVMLERSREFINRAL